MASFMLDESEMQEPRSPDEYYAWVMQTCRVLGASSEAKAYARSGARLPTKFYDELFPLAVFINHEYSGRGDLQVVPNLGNENFDATVRDAQTGEPVLFVETTYAKDGHDDSMRMEYLSEHGHVSMTGILTYTGIRGRSNRKVMVESAAAAHSDLRDQQLALIDRRITAKSGKSYGTRHVLLVAADDYLALSQNEDSDHVDMLVRKLVSTLPLDFARVVVAGVAEKLYGSYPCTVRRAVI